MRVDLQTLAMALALIPAISACGKKDNSPASSSASPKSTTTSRLKGKSVPPVDPVQDQTAPSPDEQTWTVTSKMCRGKSVMSNFPEQYVFNGKSQASHVFISSDSTSTQCQQTVTYTRLIVTYSSQSGTYTEAAQLTQPMVRTVCRNKTNGQVVEPVVSDVTQVGSAKDRMLVNLSTVNKTMKANFHGSSECQKQSTLVVTLKR